MNFRDKKLPFLSPNNAQIVYFCEKVSVDADEMAGTSVSFLKTDRNKTEWW